MESLSNERGLQETWSFYQYKKNLKFQTQPISTLSLSLDLSQVHEALQPIQVFIIK